MVRDSELDHNGMRKFTAADAKDSEPISSAAGVKSVNSMTITSSHIHDNWWNGIWCDVYRHDLPVQNNTYIYAQDNVVKNNGKIGISDEVCTTARISGNRIIHNGYNLEAMTTRSGILVSGLQDAEVFDNVVRYNKRYGIKLAKNHRATSPTEIQPKVEDRRFLKRRGVPSLRAIEWTCRRTNVGGKDTPMRTIHHDDDPRQDSLLDLDEIARAGAKKMRAEALEAEVQAYVQAARVQRDENGHALVLRNGHARKRKVVLGHRAVEVRAPRVEVRRVDADGNKHRFLGA